MPVVLSCQLLGPLSLSNATQFGGSHSGRGDGKKPGGTESSWDIELIRPGDGLDVEVRRERSQGCGRSRGWRDTQSTSYLVGSKSLGFATSGALPPQRTSRDWLWRGKGFSAEKTAGTTEQRQEADCHLWGQVQIFYHPGREDVSMWGGGERMIGASGADFGRAMVYAWDVPVAHCGSVTKFSRWAVIKSEMNNILKTNWVKASHISLFSFSLAGKHQQSESSPSEGWQHCPTSLDHCIWTITWKRKELVCDLGLCFLKSFCHSNVTHVLKNTQLVLKKQKMFNKLV